MLKRYRIFLLVVFVLPLSCQRAETSLEYEAPNIIYILADDLGYGELGVYGQDLIETPNIDALAVSGMRFTNHYSGAPVCAPARAVLLSGMHSGHVPIRGNDEWSERGDVWGYESMFQDPKLEGQRPLPDSLVTIAEMLGSVGYSTGMVGKWGLGGPLTESIPSSQGFDFFYGYNCQRQAHTLYPLHLWRNEEKVLLNNRSVAPRSNLAANADPKDEASYADFNLVDYAPKLMHDEALSFLDRQDGSRPFFLYYASPLPHVPLQAPQRWVNYYKEKLGPEEPYTGASYFPHIAPRAAYAAMISYLDEQVGDLIQKLKEIGEYENTLIIFTSDNGPTYAGGADTKYFNSAMPFETVQAKIKGQLNEGGIRVPMIASWQGRIEAGSESKHISAFHDVMATFGELSRAELPENSMGISFLPSLVGEQQTEHDFLFWEFAGYGGQQAIRKGKWKAIRKGISKGNLDLELYNLESDPREERDVAADHPDLIRELLGHMATARSEPSIERFRMPALGD